jgi:hypothetical protein
MKLTRNFSLQELTKSDTAIRKGIDHLENPIRGGYMQATYLFNQEVNT